MKTLSEFIKAKSILLPLLFISSVVIATTISIDLDKNDKRSPGEKIETKEIKKETTARHTTKNSKTVFATSITLVTPRAGSVSGGTPVTITGSGFVPPNATYIVKFNGIDATSVVRVSNSVITAVTPANFAGTVTVTVVINGDETSADNLFTYVCETPSSLIFDESMGTVPMGPPVSINDHEAANGFDNDSYTMSGTGDVRGTPVSTGYPGASGGANIFLADFQERYFQIEGINTSSYPNPQISFGFFKNQASSDGLDMSVEVSADGINFQALYFAPLPMGSTSTGWHYRHASLPSIPSTANLRIRFRQNGSTTQYRIDDVRLIASPTITNQPLSIARCPGQSATFNVTATGTGLTYQWRKDGIEINGATASSFSIPSVTQADAGSYDVVVKETCSGLITVSSPAILSMDAVPPVFTTSMTTIFLGCNPSPAAITAALGSATATDNCGSPTITQFDGPVQTVNCARGQNRFFTAIDNTGNVTTAFRFVTWIIDFIPPVMIGNFAPLTLGCNPAGTTIIAALGTAGATDACTSPTITVSDGPVTAIGCNRSQTRTFTGTDACGNTAAASRTVSWIFDITPPILTVSGGSTELGCNPDPVVLNTALGIATAFDVCSPTSLTTNTSAVVTNGCNRSQTRTFTAFDACGNFASASRTVTWTADVSPPVFIGSYSSIHLGCNPVGSAIPTILGNATASDACSGPTLTFSDGPVSVNGCNRSQTRTFTAVDACGNISTVSRTVMWIADITPPVFTGNYTTITLPCNPSSASISASLGTATATDACGSLSITQTDGIPVTNGCTLSQTRTFRALDACGNTSTISRTVSWTADNTPPIFDPTNVNFFFACNTNFFLVDLFLGTATATDACSTPTVTSVFTITGFGCTRTMVKTYTAVDACGNFSTLIKTGSWTEDFVPPVFTGNYAAVNLGCNPSGSAITSALDGATASDACGPLSITFSDGLIFTNGCNRSQTRTFTAIDACGNTSSVSRTVNWFSDFTPPTLTITGGSTNLGCNPDAVELNTALGIATALDACAGLTLTTNTGPIVSNGCNRTQTRIFTALDACGNYSSASRTVTWIADITPPAFIGDYSTVNLGCNPTPATISLALDGASASDACGAPTLTLSDSPVTANGCNRSQTRTFTAIDGCGNISSISRTVNWSTDPSPPTISVSGGPTNLGCNQDAVELNTALGIATALDGCAGLTLTTNTGPIVSNGCNRTQTRIFTALDACGNYSSASRTVTWIADITPPAFIGDYSTVNLGIDPDPTDITAALDGAIASDACGAPTLTFSDGEVISGRCERSQTRTFTAIDGCANVSTISRTVIWFCGQTREFTTNPKISSTLSKFNVKVYPNPTEHQFTLYLEGATAEKVSIVIYDAIGRLVKKIETGDASAPIQFGENLKTGAYIVEVRQGVNRRTLKVIKQ